MNDDVGGTVNALVAHQDAEGSITLVHKVVDDAFLLEGNVRIAVEFSGVNYKDALASARRTAFIVRTRHQAPLCKTADRASTQLSPPLDTVM